MKHPNRILSSYACATVERLFFVKRPDNKLIITRDLLSKYIVNILEPLCYLLKTQQNNYGIKTLYRVIQTAGPDILPYALTLGQMYALYLDTAIANPTNQTFNYLLFECIGLSVKLAKDSEALNTYEEHIAPNMFNIVSKNIPDLISYAFQILSLFVLHRKELQQNYQVVFSL